MPHCLINHDDPDPDPEPHTRARLVVHSVAVFDGVRWSLWVDHRGAVVYLRSLRDAEILVETLRRNGLTAERYHQKIPL